MADTSIQFSSLTDYVQRTGLKKIAVAEHLGVSRYQMSALLNPRRYSIRVDDDLVGRIAALLNQRPEYVRRLYPTAA